MIAESGPLPPEIVIRLLEKNELAMILPLVQELNPGVPPAVLAQRLQDMTAQGYRCAAAFADDCCIGVAGIWLGTRFWCGRYTAVTRGKRLVVLVGQKKAVAMAARNGSGKRRWSKLREWMQ